MSTSAPTSGFLARLGHWPCWALAIVSSVTLFALMLLTFIDVLGRNVASMPIPAAYELVSFMMPFIIFCALPYVNLTGAHVTIDLLDGFVPRSLRRAQHLLVHLVSAVALGFMAWRLLMRAFDHLEYGEVTVELYLPMWPFSMTMAGLAALAAVVMLIAGLLPPSADHPIPQDT
ncbi:MAG: TRAP transporter small permease [Burkholderiaceae bacterium]